MTTINYRDLSNRAMAAYFRAAALQDGTPIQPSPPEHVQHDGLDYIVLRNVDGILAVYRVRFVKGEAVLKGLKRWPKELR